MEYSDDGKDRRITQLRKGILELAVMGVLYHERHYGYSLVRVDFEGLSGAFDPYGRLLAMQDTLPGESHAMIVDVPAKRVATFYSRTGDVFAWLCLAIALGLCSLGIVRPRAAPASPA